MIAKSKTLDLNYFPYVFLGDLSEFLFILNISGIYCEVEFYESLPDILVVQGMNLKHKHVP